MFDESAAENEMKRLMLVPDSQEQAFTPFPPQDYLSLLSLECPLCPLWFLKKMGIL
jgi:hypothetical protein